MVAYQHGVVGGRTPDIFRVVVLHEIGGATVLCFHPLERENEIGNEIKL